MYQHCGGSKHRVYGRFSLTDGAEEYFSHWPCELCWNGMSGGRYDATALDDNDDVVELSLCVDCLLEVI